MKDKSMEECFKTNFTFILHRKKNKNGAFFQYSAAQLSRTERENEKTAILILPSYFLKSVTQDFGQ
jgi:hypothetical protein